MQCHYCNKTLEGVHKNRKYCSKGCEYKARYERTGQRATKEQRRHWYEKRKEREEYREKLRKQCNERRNEVQRFLREYKIMRGCVDCGYDAHHAALEFDHVEGSKKLNVCFAKSIEQARKEIAKCEVVCANCHRIRTFKRAQKECLAYLNRLMS